MSSNPMVIYIVCRGHSGSTLLELLLNRSENIAAMGELDLLPLQMVRDESTRWIGRCSCGERPHYCPVWGKVIEEISHKHAQDFLQKPFSWRISNTGIEEEFGWRRPTARLRYLFHRLIREQTCGKQDAHPRFLSQGYRRWVERRDIIVRRFAHQSDAKIVIDSSKDPQQMLDQLTYSSLPSQVIFLTRDPRGVGWSAVKNHKGSVNAETRDWAKLNGRILKLLQRTQTERWLHVRYESLCSDTEAELTRIHDFIGVPRNDIGFEQEFSTRHTIAGNKLRFEKIPTVNEDRGWESGLNASDLRSIKTHAEPIAAQLGYMLP